jgi:tetratricopeptide (TPR) repeat protein
LGGELEAIVNKALEKDRNLRYQHASDIRTDLQRLKRETESARVTASAKAQARTGIGKRWKAIIPAAAVVLALSVGGYFYFRRTLKLTNKDTIVLADFTNTTGDPVFDGTLRQAMAVQLEQSPFLSLVSEQQIRQTLTLMGKPGDAKLTPAIAVQLCQRTGSTAVLEGSIANIGSQYVLGFKAVNCRTGNNLTEEQVRATNKEQVLTAADKAAVSLRRSLGESLSTVEKFSTPLEQATTPSLEALQAYSLATEKNLQGESAPSLPFFERAIQLDPNFAMAYTGLGYTYSNISEPSLAAVNFKKAYDLRDRVTEREKLVIESAYYWNVSGDLGKTIQALEILEQTYPRNVWGAT